MLHQLLAHLFSPYTSLWWSYFLFTELNIFLISWSQFGLIKPQVPGYLLLDSHMLRVISAFIFLYLFFLLLLLAATSNVGKGNQRWQSDSCQEMVKLANGVRKLSIGCVLHHYLTICSGWRGSLAHVTDH